MTLVYDQDIQARKIFVGGLATATDDRSFVEYFQQYGDITDSIVMFDKVTGNPKRFGFVVFAEVSSMEKCLAACPHTVDGAEVNVKHASKPTPGRTKWGEDQGNCEIHAVFPFGSTMDKDQITMYFSQFGLVVGCTIPMNKVLNRPKNFCFIKFNERTAVLKALDKKQHKMGEKYILVTEFVEKEKAKKAAYGPCGRKQDIKIPMKQESQDNSKSSGRNFYNEPPRDPYYDDSYGNWYDDKPSQFSGRGDYDRRSFQSYDGSGDGPQRSFRAPARPAPARSAPARAAPIREVPDGYEYILVKKQPELPMSRMDEGPYVRDREFPMRRSAEFDRYSPPHDGYGPPQRSRALPPPPPMMRGGPMRNRGGPRDRFNPIARPQRNNQMVRPQHDNNNVMQRGYIDKSKWILQDNKLKITGLSRHSNNDTMGAYFSQFGEIFEAVVICDPSGESRQFGFVTFVEKASVDDVLNSGPHFFDGSDINVKKAIFHGKHHI